MKKEAAVVILIDDVNTFLEFKQNMYMYFQWRQSRLKTTSAKWDFEAPRLEIWGIRGNSLLCLRLRG